MPEINSVAGQLVGVPIGQVYTAGKGVVIDNVNKTVRTDETVLFEETNYTYGRSSVTLSEDYRHFECIKIFNSKGNVQFYYPANAQEVALFTLTNFSNGFLWLIPWTFQNDGVTYSGATGKLWTVGSTTAADVPSNAPSNRWIQPTKIVGINRISA